MRGMLTIARVKPEHRDDYLAATRAYSAASIGEDGCARHDVLVEQGDGARVCLSEVYRDQAAVESHLASPHFKAWRDAVTDWYAEPPTVIRGEAGA